MTQATEKDIGKWCKFEDGFQGICIQKLYSIIYYKNKIVFEPEDIENHYAKCTPLTQEQIKCLGLEE